MAYKQPRVPQLRQGTQLKDYVYELVLFLRDFCMETWVQIRNLQGVELPESLTQETVQALLDEQAKTLREEMAVVKREAIDSALPVGIVVKFATSSDPNSLYPWQTWTQITDGRVEIAANGTYPLGSTGGEAAHTLTVDEMPSHIHQTLLMSYGTSADWGDRTPAGSGSGTLIFSDDFIRPTGGNQPHNNMQPYVARNVWQRTA